MSYFLWGKNEGKMVLICGSGSKQRSSVIEQLSKPGVDHTGAQKHSHRHVKSFMFQSRGAEFDLKIQS